MEYKEYRALVWKRAFSGFWTAVGSIAGLLTTGAGIIGAYWPENEATVTSWVLIAIGISLLSMAAYRLWMAPFWIYDDINTENKALKYIISSDDPELRIESLFRTWGPRSNLANNKLQIKQIAAVESGGYNGLYLPMMRQIKEAANNRKINIEPAELDRHNSATETSCVDIFEVLENHWCEKYPSLKEKYESWQTP